MRRAWTLKLLGRMGGQSASLALHQNPQHGSGSLRILKSMASVAEVKAPHSAKFHVVCCGSPTSGLFGDLRQAAVMPSPYATNKANLIEMLTYCRAHA